MSCVQYHNQKHYLLEFDIDSNPVILSDHYKYIDKKRKEIMTMYKAAKSPRKSVTSKSTISPEKPNEKPDVVVTTETFQTEPNDEFVDQEYL